MSVCVWLCRRRGVRVMRARNRFRMRFRDKSRNVSVRSNITCTNLLTDNTGYVVFSATFYCSAAVTTAAAAVS